MNSKIFLLGGGGFLGRHLCTKFLRSGAQVVSVGPQKEGLPSHKNYTVIDAKLHDFDVLKEHLAHTNIFYYLVNTTSPAKLEANPSVDIAEGVANLVEFCRFVSTVPNAKVVFTSSGGTVYGDAAEIPTPETAVCHPKSLYGMTKLVGEQYIRLFAEQNGFDYVICRIANPYGPDQALKRGQGLIPAVVENLSSGKSMSIIGDGQFVRDYIYIDDAIDALMLAGIRHALTNQILNIGSGSGRSVLEVIWEIANILNVSFDLNYLPNRDTDVRTSILSISKIHSMVGWHPKTSFAHGLNKTIETTLQAKKP